MAEKKAITSAGKLKVLGPYSLAIQTGGFIFVSGQIGINPETDVFAGEDVTAQGEQAFKNITSILKEVGATLRDVVKVDIFLKNMQDFARLNDVYKKVFDAALGGGPYPARCTSEAPALPKGALLEIAVTCAK